MPKASSVLFSLLTILYPILVYLGFKYSSMETTNLFILFLLLIRVVFQKKNGPIEKLMFFVCCLMAGISLIGLLIGQASIIKLYPVIVNFSLALLFGLSLRKEKTPIIESLARLREKLDSRGVIYTRGVTKVWLFFFVLNGFVSLSTFFFASLEVWTFYNAFLSYLLIGGLFLGEFLFRLYYKKKGPSL